MGKCCGDDEGTMVEEVGTGVGYETRSWNASCERLGGRGSWGDDEKGSNAGNREEAGFFILREGDW